MYTKAALLWPFKWSRWWIPLDELANYPLKQQITYYNEVDSSEEVLWKLAPAAWLEIVKDKHCDRFQKVTEIIRKNDRYFVALLGLTRKEQKVCRFMRCYLNSGTLPKLQMTKLADEACVESKQHSDGRLAEILYDYIGQCGIGRDLFERIMFNAEATDSFKDEVTKRDNDYKQKCDTRRLYNLQNRQEVDEWRELCAPKKRVCVAAQQEMSPKQYEIFHKNGHRLDSAAISWLLWHEAEHMASLIFRYEPKFGIQNANISLALDKRPHLKPMLSKIVKATEADLRKRIYASEELNAEQLNKLFDCPAAGDLLIEYLGHWSLPYELHKRILELKDGSKVICFYNTQGQNIDEEVRCEAVKRGWLPASEADLAEATADTDSLDAEDSKVEARPNADDNIVSEAPNTDVLPEKSKDYAEASFLSAIYGVALVWIGGGAVSIILQCLLIWFGGLFPSVENCGVLLDTLLGMFLVLPLMMGASMGKDFGGNGNVIVGLLAIMGIYICVVWYFHWGILLGCIVLLCLSLSRLSKFGGDSVWIYGGASAYLLYCVGAYVAMLITGAEPAIDIYGVLLTSLTSLLIALHPVFDEI